MKLQLNYIFSLMVLFLLMGAENTYAQTVLRGRVTDSQTKEPIVGATVAELASDNRTVTAVTTDMDGNYAITLKGATNRLNVSFIGYHVRTLPINNQTQLNVSLVSSDNQIEEVAISRQQTGTNTGLLNIAQRDLTTATATINAKVLQDMQSSSIDEALQGRLPGVDISANSGDPGSGMSIRIRGTSSLSGNAEPLIVVDGMPYETSIPGDFNFGTADEDGYAQLLNIAPADIETITVLKDAAATAVWGSRASNGVLLITTKRGTMSKPTINYSFRGSLSSLPDAIPLLNGNQYSQLIPEMVMNRTGTPLNTLTFKEFQYDPGDVYYYNNYSQNTDWIDAITQTGLSNDHTFSIQGGGEKARYYSSVGYLGQRGVTVGTGLERISARLNLDYEISDRIKFRTDIAYTHTVTDRNYVNTKDNQDNIRGLAYIKMPNMSLYEYDRYGNEMPVYFSPDRNIQGAYPGTYNPAAMAEYASNRHSGERITPVFNLKYDIIPSKLISDFQVMFDINNARVNNFLPQLATGRPYTETVVNRAGESDHDSFRLQTKANLIYFPIATEKHDLQMLLSWQTDEARGLNYESLISNTASTLLTDPSNPGRTQNNELALFAGMGESRSIGGLFSTQYKLNDKYIINAGLRADANSKFGANNRFGLFPSISTRWRVSGEEFMKNIPFINELSLRASYGQSGRAPRYDYLFYSNIVNNATSYLGETGVFPANMELRNLKWETVKGQNVGFNVEVWDRKVRLDVDFYRNRTVDMLFENLGVPNISGYNSIWLNSGTMDNQGWEVGLNATPYRTNDLTIDFSFNIARNMNVIREIPEFLVNEQGRGTVNGEFKRILQMNNPIGSFYGYRYEGVYSTTEETIAKDVDGNNIIGPDGEPVYMRFNYPYSDYVFQAGDARYADINNDGSIDERDIVYLGNSSPRLTGGFGPSVNIKNRLRIALFFNFRTGYDVVNGAMMHTTKMHNYDNQSTAVMSRWRNEGDVTDMPRALLAEGYNWLGSDRYVQDASFLRFRSATVSYSFGQDLMKRLGMSDLRMYVTGENFFTWTNYLGQDPEINMQKGIFGVAWDDSRTPPTMRFTLGLSTRF
ncbi:SusC/RagA family TonB-linked outer membrane protein [Sphingobacterium alkalisoli]|uniref:SusC/RagA family TonB-linked outer membrane protein n=1 Tax=Sphingobacterium alkalisoli TaxID=1874115 RepID=A0A4U0H9A9_9SPHI|nr:SusC/RagA family TonB-linked outer membrane protein [Sphingobacterium alkalisoli]TJY68366.1 SusC/RagA family TonB-linked outer membrane protein [Sphingobacterium alkalisoli]